MDTAPSKYSAPSRKDDAQLQQHKPWRRILYEHQPYPDNHTDSTFLERLVLNGRVVPRRLSKVILDAWTVSQQCAVVALKTCCTVGLMHGLVESNQVLTFTCALLLLGLVLTIVVIGFRYTVMQFLRIGPLMAVTLLLLTPLFQTMTSAISDDTALSTSVVALLVSLFFHEYFEKGVEGTAGVRNIPSNVPSNTSENTPNTISLTNSNTTSLNKVGNGISLGASMLATSILASRLTDPSAVFADVLLATTLFVLFPFASRFLSKRLFKVHVVGVGVSHACAVSAMYHMTVGSVPLITAYSLLILFITFLCPITLTNLMRFKKQINGPWDEADVRGTNVSLSTGKGTGGRKIVMAGNGHGVGF